MEKKNPMFVIPISKQDSKRMEKAKRMPIGTESKGRRKVAEGKWVPVKKRSGRKESGQAGAFPRNVRNLTVDAATSFITQAVKMSLKTLRKNQDIVDLQKEKAHKMRNDKALERLEVMRDIYTAAVDIKEFKDNTPKEWAQEIVGRISRM